MKIQLIHISSVSSKYSCAAKQRFISHSPSVSSEVALLFFCIVQLHYFNKWLVVRYYFPLKHITAKQVCNKVFWKKNRLKKNWARVQLGNELNIPLIILNLQVIGWSNMRNYFWVKFSALRLRMFPSNFWRLNRIVVLLFVLHICHLKSQNEGRWAKPSRKQTFW